MSGGICYHVMRWNVKKAQGTDGLIEKRPGHLTLVSEIVLVGADVLGS
jgi:hypothetical protein